MAFAAPMSLYGQVDIRKSEVNANFQINAQTYSTDEALNITDSSLNGQTFRMNGYGDIRYRLGNFNAGFRFESYLPPLDGFDTQYEGVGIPYWFASYSGNNFEVTAGNFYEQFGNGLILRSYQEWDLGYDNSIKGLRVKFNTGNGIYVTALAGVHRYYWEPYSNGNRGIIRAFDLYFDINELIPSFTESRTRLSLGGSFVSKYEDAEKSETFIEEVNDTTTITRTYEYELPKNVSAVGGRLNLSRGGFNLYTEYVYKYNNPSEFNNYIYKIGEGLLANLTYSQKGLGIFLGYKRIDNMSYKSKITEIGNALDINYIPPFTHPHTYALPALYPYASQLNGENTVQAEITYRIPRNTALGGKYGMVIEANYSIVHGLKRNFADTVLTQTSSEKNGFDAPRGTIGYTSEFFAWGPRYFQDLNFKIEKKISKKVWLILQYLNLTYNIDVIEGTVNQPIVHANMGIVDVTWRLPNRKSLRFEYQHLFTDQDRGDWAMFLAELSIAPKWFFSVQNQFNYGNPDEDLRLHYYTANVAYVHGAHRLSLGYGRTPEGILCIGGVCRRVPSAKGFTLTVTSSF
jgi:hypothetical protein